MKKLVSLVSTAALLMTLAPASLAESGAEYIAAPYTIEDTTKGPSEYLAPVFYENEGGPSIGVTLVGVIKEDGKYFKDSNNNKELDPFEDWRLDTAARAADLVAKMTVNQRLGLLANQLMATPTAKTAAEAKDENGNVLFDQLMTVTEDAFHMEPVEGAGWSDPTANSTGRMLTMKSRSGVLRATTDAETGALWNNAANMVAEYDAVASNEPNIPFTIISNPQNVIGIPGSMGVAAAVMGSGAETGDFSLIERYADLDRQLWAAKGIDAMYGPQIDLITDPRWNRNSGTYTEVPEVMAGIASALVKGYQDGTAVSDSVTLTVKHFPGDCAAYNGFESHNYIGEWRVYATEGSLEKYHLAGFQAAIDAGVTGIMPGYSRPSNVLSAKQTYRGVEIPVEEIGNAYNTTVLTKLLRETMGFDGYINTDSGIVTGQFFGAEEMTVPERLAAIVKAGSDVIGDGVGYAEYQAAYEQGLFDEASFTRATTNRVSILFDMGRFENPYRDVEASIAAVDAIADQVTALGTEINQKSVVLMKNHEGVLPMTDTSKKVFIASYTEKGENEDTLTAWTAAFEGAGYTIVKKAEEADVAFLSVVPGGVSNSNNFMNVIDLVDGLEVEERSFPESTTKSGAMTEATTLMDVKKIAKTAEAVHANGGVVVASINITSPWILTNLEPYCDALIGSFDTKVAAQMNVLTGAYNPTGKLPVTMVSCNEVIAVVDTEIEGQTYEICVSPNDVPGYDKDQYISAEVLAQSPSGSYAYKDADGNVYAAWFGLSY